jgi:hypothetical protein
MMLHIQSELTGYSSFDLSLKFKLAVLHFRPNHRVEWDAPRNVSMVLRHFFRKITVEAFPPSPVDPVCALPGRQAY